MVRCNLVLLFVYLFASIANANNNEISEKFNNILTGLEKKIGTKTPGNEYVKRAFDFTVKKIRDNEISAIYDDKMNYGIIGCASANIQENGVVSISFGDFIIEAHEFFPSLVEGILVHEFQHVYDFFNNPELISISADNPIERAFFEIDGLTLEGLYFKSYISSNDTVSNLENFFLADLDNGLWSVIAVFAQVDLQLLHQIDDIEKNQASFKLATDDFIQIGEKLLSTFELGDNQWNNYGKLVSLRTYTYHSRQVLRDMLYTLEGKDVKDNELKLTDYPKIDDIVEKALHQINENETFFRDYRKGVIDSFDDNIVSGINR